MRILVTEKISPHRFKTPEGYLICTDCVLSRTGKQTYHRSEIFDTDDDSEVEVDRTEEEVFSDKALASFENKPIAIDHPDEDINVDNYKDYAVGFVRDIHRGKDDGQDVMLGTLVVTDKEAIEKIESGDYQQLSCGYECDIADELNPQQKNIRGNHVALCECGRAGNARIVDTADDLYGLVKEPTTRYFLAKYFDEKWETDDNVAVIKAKNETEAKSKLKQSGIKYDSIKELTHAEYIKFARIVKVIDSVKDVNPRKDESKDDFIARFMSETKEEYPDRKQRFAVANSYWNKRTDDAEGFGITTLKKFMSNNTRYERYCSTLEEAIREKAALERADGQTYVIVELKSKRRADTMKDADYSKKTSQGYDVVAMYRDGGRLHAILKRANDYVVAYGYDTTDGTWAQGDYDAKSFDEAVEWLMKTKPSARRIQDCTTDSTDAARGYAFMIDTYSMNKDRLEDIVTKIKASDRLTKDEKERLITKADSLISSLERMEDSKKDEESTYTKVTKELKKNEPKDSLKEYRVKDSKGKTYKVKADSVETAMKIVKEFKNSKKK